MSFILIMNAGSLSLQKISAMKASIFLKIFFILPLILFVDYLLMALIGCTSCLFSFGDGFYCGPFCLAGKIILALSVIPFGYLIYPDLKAIFKSEKNGAAT
jgi:hypothetical protein